MRPLPLRDWKVVTPLLLLMILQAEQHHNDATSVRKELRLLTEISSSGSSSSCS